MELELEGGGSAHVTESDGNFVTLVSTRAFPPGSTLRGQATTGGYRVKVRGSRRLPDAGELPRFQVEGRWVGLSREQRQHVLAPTPPKPAP